MALHRAERRSAGPGGCGGRRRAAAGPQLATGARVESSRCLVSRSSRTSWPPARSGTMSSVLRSPRTRPHPLSLRATARGCSTLWRRPRSLIGRSRPKCPVSLKPVVALTFDDGPTDVATGAILDVLAARGVAATFFVFGMRAVAHHDLIARMMGAGHEVQPHCWAGHESHHD